jgi:hypothetical protein
MGDDSEHTTVVQLILYRIAAALDGMAIPDVRALVDEIELECPVSNPEIVST